jgi:glutamate dehydrogenase
MEVDGVDLAIREEKLKIYRRDQKLAYLYASQRSFIDSFITLLNCDEDGTLRAKSVVDYWKRPEYIYLGPDENMFNDMIVWIANYAVQCGYKPGRSFMSSKPGAGINHKEYGVTSFGVNVYMHELLLYLGIDPAKDRFTIKISGGPDGDVAGNQILNLYKYYPKTAKLLALTDVSGTIYDPEGLDLKEMADLFYKSLPIRSYPVEKLSEGGFLLDVKTKKEQNAYTQQTLCWRKKGGKLVEDWLSGNEMNHLYRNNVHQVKTDIFIPGGGRPRTLNDANYLSFLDDTGKPTSKAIAEGANLYLTPGARRALEKLGVLIIKDSSCNKGGVTCSSFEVLAGLCMSEDDFIKQKDEFVKEVLEIIRKAALNEARLLLSTHQETGEFLTDISEKISERINLYKYQLLEHLEKIELSQDPKDPLIRCLFLYCPPLLREKYKKAILAMPDIHKKAVISCFLASRLVYVRGLDWSPSIADILSTVAEDPAITQN